MQRKLETLEGDLVTQRAALQTEKDELIESLQLSVEQLESGGRLITVVVV